MPIWNPKAIDYSAGVTIYDYETKKVYSEEEAKKQPAEIRRRLLLKPNKIGCWVLSLEEVKKLKW